MAQTNNNTARQPEPLRVSRTYLASRELVFKAWSSADHVRRWFAPTGISVPHCQVQLQPQGVFDLCMRMPDGTDHWIRGRFVQVTPPERLVIDMSCEDGQRHRLFGAYTEVNLSAVPEGTRVDVVQTYTLLDPKAANMIGGAPIGWSQTLDNLAAELNRMKRESVP